MHQEMIEFQAVCDASPMQHIFSDIARYLNET